MGEFDLFKLARKAWRPTSLVALVLFILFLILRAILSLNVFSTLSEENTFRLLNNIALGLFLLAALTMLVGIIAYIVTRTRPTPDGNARFEEGSPVLGDDETSKPLPTFEIGVCTEGSPFQMQCTGEIIQGVEAAIRVVEEIERYTKPSESPRFDVRVTGMERIRSYLAEMTEPEGGEIETRHQLNMALEDWDKHRTIFRIGVEFILWHPVFRNTAYIYNSKSAAETICGLSKYCFGELPRTNVSTWFLWYDDEQRTRQQIHVTEAIIKDLTEYPPFLDDKPSSELRKDRSYPVGEFNREARYLYVLPQLLIFVAKEKVEMGASLVTLDKHLDVTKWRWSIHDPDEFVKWK